MGTADDDNNTFGSLDRDGSIVNEGNGTCRIFVEEVARCRGIAAGFVRNVGQNVKATIKLDSMVHRMEVR